MSQGVEGLEVESNTGSSEADGSTTGSSEADYSGNASVCSEDHEEGEGPCSLAREGSRKLIKPDLLAMSQLLNFDEVSEWFFRMVQHTVRYSASYNSTVQHFTVQ